MPIEPPQTPVRSPRRPWWTQRRIALAGIGCQVLALARTLADLFTLVPPGNSLPSMGMAVPWGIGAAIAAIGALVSAVLLLNGRERQSIGVAIAVIAALVAYRLLVLT